MLYRIAILRYIDTYRTSLGIFQWNVYLIFHHLVFASPSTGPKPVLSSGGASVMSSTPLGQVPRSLMQDGSAWQSAIAPLHHWSNICTVVLASCSWPIPAVHWPKKQHRINNNTLCMHVYCIVSNYGWCLTNGQFHLVAGVREHRTNF